MGETRVPNYDLPNPAPEPLRQVQLFVNSIDREHEREWLPDWLAKHGLAEADFDRALRLRESLRKLLHVHNVGGDPSEALAVVEEHARMVRIVPRDGAVEFAGDDALASITAIVVGAIADGSFRRLKVCRNCEWAFWDPSKNRSGSWCSMQLCGNRLKTRAYRARRRSIA